MTLGKAFRCMVVGFLFAVLALGLLPFLAAYELFQPIGLGEGFHEYVLSPLYQFAINFIEQSKS
ncbi:hypothetical protein MJA45_21950 [Paenibacillus aurantius]|uniref:Uncharacterized protein n=1 Tax=Paenibacillus aurantius TaxID=2918900 RepID=A0AA96RGP1_9BACL|nr:hypothetical protein [Paenibacillus aurantius]WNQ10259.1 hypothetical protein MJA45_21950 [Paenibacillus aurantius]